MTDDRLYFRQLLAGRDFAVDDQIARQMVNFVYLVGDRETREAMIVDPAYGVRELVEIVGADGLRVTGALVTHYHPDHVGGSLMGWEIEGVAALLGLEGVSAPIHVNRAEARGVHVVTGASDSDLVLHDSGDVVTVGSVPITLLHTPGHTPGSQCFLVDGRLVAGDTLFLEGCGRTDLPGGDPDEMYRSLTQRLATIPDDTMLYPGHQYSAEPSATMGATRETNYVFRLPTLEQWRMMFGRVTAPMEIRDGNIAMEPGRTLAAEMWADMAVRYADDPTAPEPKGETDDLHQEELAPPTGRFILVYDGEEPIGCGAIRRHDDETAEIKRMWVRPAARGRGVARRVLDELESSAVAIGYRATVLETGLRQPEALALYESHGYTRIPNYGFYRRSALSRCYRKELVASSS